MKNQTKLNEIWAKQATFYEYGSAANPKMPKIDVVPFEAELHENCIESKVTQLNLSDVLQTTYPATSPSLLANFIHIKRKESLLTKAHASSQIFYVISGKGKSELDDGEIYWKKGDYFAIPYCEKIVHYAEERSTFYWVTDQPLMDYLDVRPSKKAFRPVYYSEESLTNELLKVRKANEGKDKNRNGILLSNLDCPLTKTVTHTQWSLYNVLPARSKQKAHRHNSIALDFVVKSGAGTYTLIGKDLDENGHIVNPIRADWKPGRVFVTPAGWWHSHHNESDDDAIVLPVQDAGLHTYLQTLDIQFSKGY